MLLLLRGGLMMPSRPMPVLPRSTDRLIIPTNKPAHTPCAGLLDVVASFPRAMAELDRLDLSAQDLKSAVCVYV